jgi:HEAT repeat protein
VTRIPGATLGALFLVLSLTPAIAQEQSAPPTPEQLAAIERVRPLVTAIWTDVHAPAAPDKDYLRYFWQITDQLIALGPDVVPFLTSELDLADPVTFPFAAYSLGQFPGPASEVALRKAARVADGRGGRFGQACKRWAVFGLALLGKPEVLDLVQEGEEIQRTEMVPDLILMTHLAVLVGPAANPVLSKQLDTYGPDPEATEQMQYALLALGRTGDASYVPRLLPLLQSKSAGIRAQAADAISRLGPPDICLQIMPLLADPKQRENYAVADALVRSKPEPCYKAMVARLEIEENIEVRGALYAAVAVLGGEASLDVFRSYLSSKNFVDRTMLADMIGRVGSKKGLNMLRALLADPSGNVAERAVESIGKIGGEGAVDTLLAMTADRRRNIALTACRVLTEMGVKKAGPRIAVDLLDMVREPVGELELRAPIVQLSEALVTLEYADPAEDLEKAIGVQEDPEIKDTLTSCVRRLGLIAHNGDDPALWIEALASPLPEVRILAARRLAEIGAPAGVAALEARLARPDVEHDERAAIFRAFADAKTTGAASLVEQNLANPAADGWDVRDVRAEAAWAARRIGGERMAKALRASAVRRQGQDWATLVYLAVVDKGAAIDTLKSLRTQRLRRPEVRVGREDKQLGEILADLAAGRAPALYDEPPNVLLEM